MYPITSAWLPMWRLRKLLSCEWNFVSWQRQNSMGQTELFFKEQKMLHLQILYCLMKRESSSARNRDVSSSSSPVGQIVSGYPNNVYNCNRLSLPKLRQKMAQSCGMMFIDLWDGCFYGGWYTWNTFPVSEQKITLSNQITNNRMKENEQKQRPVRNNQHC
jgi:hypothetical protein